MYNLLYNGIRRNEINLLDLNMFQLKSLTIEDLDILFNNYQNIIPDHILNIVSLTPELIWKYRYKIYSPTLLNFVYRYIDYFVENDIDISEPQLGIKKIMPKESWKELCINNMQFHWDHKKVYETYPEWF